MDMDGYVSMCMSEGGSVCERGRSSESAWRRGSTVIVFYSSRGSLRECLERTCREEEEVTSLNRWIASDDLLPKKFPMY